MGDVSIIVRRLRGGYVQYGWSGNGGYFKTVGARLLYWYDTPDLVEYLFDLGQLARIGQPGSEVAGTAARVNSHRLAAEPHYLGTTEREIFSKIAFIDYGYFYDLDQKWYYVIPGPFRIKIPLELISNNLDEQGHEFDYMKKIEQDLISYLFGSYITMDEAFREKLKEFDIDGEALKKKLLEDSFPVHLLFDDYNTIFKYFDDWILVTADDRYEIHTGFIVQPKAKAHTETIEWREAGGIP